ASPFELSEADLTLDEPKNRPPSRGGSGRVSEEEPLLTLEDSGENAGPSDSSSEVRAASDSSSDFELSAAPDGSSPLELGSDELPSLQPEDDSDEVTLGELSEAGSGSGINLDEPADSGISLEQESSDEIEFELSVEEGTTPKPSPGHPAEDSDSGFELTLDEEGSSEVATGESSEFELSLDDSGSSELEVDLEPVAEGGADSDSEFELTLDDTGGSPLEE